MRRPIIFVSLVTIGAGSAAADEATSYALLSTLHRGASQNYDARGRECEAALFSMSGNQEYEKPQLTIELKAQGGAIACRQALNEGGLVLGITYESLQIAWDGVILRSESFTTRMEPSLMYALGPMVTLGFALNFDNSELKTTNARSATFSYTSELSLSAHQDSWEVTLVSGDRWRDDQHKDQEVPRSLAIQALGKPFPYFGLGLRIGRVDYAGVADDEERVQNESSFGVIATSQFLDVFTAQVAADMVSADGGDPDRKGKSLEALLGYRFNQTIKMAATASRYSSENGADRMAITSFAMSLGAMF